MILLFIFWINFFSFSFFIFWYVFVLFSRHYKFFFHDIFFSFSFFLTLCCSGTKVEKHHADESKKNNNITSKSFLDFLFFLFYLKVGRSEEVFSFFSNLQKYEPNQCPQTFPMSGLFIPYFRLLVFGILVTLVA